MPNQEQDKKNNCDEKRECPYCKKLVVVSRVLMPVRREGVVYDSECFECSECKKEFYLLEQYEPNQKRYEEAKRLKNLR